MQKVDLELLKENLLNKQGIIGKNKYFNSAVLIPLVLLDDEYHILFEKRAIDIRQGGEVCFPGGKYEDEDLGYESTAIRETTEELGISKEEIEIIGKLGTIVAAMGATIDTFIGVIKIEALTDLVLNPKEVAEVFTVPLSFFLENPPEEYKVRLEIQPSYITAKGEKVVLLPSKELGLPERYIKPWGGKKYSVYCYKVKDEIIWGLTAELIKELVARIKSSDK